MSRLGLRSAALAGVAALALVGLATPARAMAPSADRTHAGSCFDPRSVGAGARGGDTRVRDLNTVTPAQQRAVEARTKALLARRSTARSLRAAVPVSVPVYVHVMRDAKGKGNVTNTQVTRQIAELNQDYAGGESTEAADTGFTFTLAGIDRYKNTTWHQDKQSATYRAKTRLGGRNALNIWLVDFAYLGVATFPWDYAAHQKIDGIRVEFTTLPGGSETDYNLGKTVTHEAGHWFGLYHTFEGGCTSINDEVADTPAQAGPTSGCPTKRNSCSLPGLDPIHNYMDYSYDSCYNQFTPGQATRMQQMFTAYRT